MNTRYFSIVGYSKSGKTYLIEHIIQYLIQKEYTVGVIKSIHHPGFGIDIKEKDTTRYSDAGAILISYIAPDSSGIIYKLKDQNKKIFSLFENEVDFVILEGFTNINFIPQFVLIKEPQDFDKFINFNTVGIYSHILNVKDHRLYIEFNKIPELVEKLAFPHIPLLNCKKCGFNSCTDFYKNFISQNIPLEKCVLTKLHDVLLYLNENIVPLNKFASNILKNIIIGCINSLKLPEKSISNIKLKIKL
ncbi:MAG: molybdopterin-guanine dinucleotide biosynthesis protein MobB [Candidatus Helarchaeota archaeon]